MVVSFPKEEGKEFIRQTLPAKDHQGDDAKDSDNVEKGAKDAEER